MKTDFLNLLLISLFFFGSCSDNRKEEPNHVFVKDSLILSDYDLSDIESTGEIIIVTMYGKDTYYNYHGKSTGLAYDLISDYAINQGLLLRVETVKDTASMIRMLTRGDVDLIVCELPEKIIKSYGLVGCGAFSKSLKDDSSTSERSSWAARKNQPDLISSLDEWYKSDLKEKFLANENKHIGKGAVRCHVRAPYLSRSKGIISPYDTYFMQGCRLVGWDWKLIAALCYQESGFDPNAISWAGAKGLMQIIPSTAESLGLSDIYNPAENINAGCKYLQKIQNKFSDVRSRNDKICFTLASYNGGYLHIRDAMNLTRKKGKNPYSWKDVRYYVRNLDKSQYYNDPIVKYGYMIGAETYNYVESIIRRWGKYRDGKPVDIDNGVPFMVPMRSKRKNRFTNPQNIESFRDSL